ncbi:MAG: hypothetical protein LJE68_09790, partial [Rhodobacter sp.]|nr:hypothetical protein [Rhodobacter sp.]
MALDRSSTPHHRVLRARFEIEGSSEASLLRLREQIVTLGDTALPAALEAAFDGLAGADEVISIARLHVDLGEVDADTLDLSRLTEATRAALMEQIGKHVH